MAEHAHEHGAGGAVHHGPNTSTYLKVAAFLTIVTAMEVGLYYVPGLPQRTAIFVPALLILSALKFVGVVAFYMHLKYDHRIFRGLFGGPLIIAMGTIVAFIALFVYARGLNG